MKGESVLQLDILALSLTRRKKVTLKNLPVSAGTQDRGDKFAANAEKLAATRKEASVELLKLFGGTTAEGTTIRGMLHEHGLEKLQANPAWNKYLGEIRGNERAKELAIVMASRDNPNYPPNMVAQMFAVHTNEPEKNRGLQEWLENVFIEGLREVYLATDRIRGGAANIAAQLPVRGKFEFYWVARNVFQALTKEDREALGLFEPGQGGARKHANKSLEDLLGETEQRKPATPAQKLNLWVWKNTSDKPQQDGQGGGDADPTAGLPPAPKNAALPEPPSAPGLPPPPTSAASNAPPVAPKPPRNKKQAAAPATVPPPPASTASSAGEQTASAGANGAPPVPTAAPGVVKSAIQVFAERLKAAGLEKPERISLLAKFAVDPAAATAGLEVIESL